MFGLAACAGLAFFYGRITGGAAGGAYTTGGVYTTGGAAITGVVIPAATARALLACSTSAIATTGDSF